MQNKSISVIIPTHNSSEYLQSCLEAIKKSDLDNFEIIVIDDGSTDNTAELAEKFADRVIRIKKCESRLAVRMLGFKLAQSDFVVNIDSDVVIKPDALSLIVQHFKQNPEVTALTGLLSAESPVPGFFSSYKNLYMNYKFLKLPDRISFLYGSIFAVRKDRNLISTINSLETNMPASFDGDDTELAHVLTKNDTRISFLRELEVIHLKSYSFKSIIINDFLIPKSFVGIMLRFSVKPEISLKRPVFSHTLPIQIISIFVAYSCVISLLISGWLSVSLLFTWVVLNFSFFRYIFKKKQIVYTLLSVAFTFLDHIIMGLGIISGFLLFRQRPQKVLSKSEMPAIISG